MSEKYFSTSPYAYVQNNPISHFDVMGLWSFSVYFDNIYGGTMFGEGNSWSGASFSGNIPGGTNGEYAGIMSSIMGGHWSTGSHTNIRINHEGWGLRSSGNHSFKRFWNWMKGLHIDTYTTYEDVWVWDNEETQNSDYSDVFAEDDPPDGGDPPNWNTLTNAQRMVVILNAMHHANKKGEIYLNINKLFANIPSAVPNGDVIYKADIKIGDKVVKNIVLDICIWSYDNIIYPQPSQDNGAGGRDKNGVYRQQMLLFKSTTGFYGLGISFPTKYNDFFRHWLLNWD